MDGRLPPKVEEMSLRGMELIRSLDSRSFGFLDLHPHTSGGNPAMEEPRRPNDQSNLITRDFIHQGIKQLHHQLKTGPTQSETFRAEIFCHLGHLHLLIEEYTQALSAYEQYQKLCPEQSRHDSTLLYGLGLIYFHMQAYTWAMDIFRKILLICPNFARIAEIHLRLGVMCKVKGELPASLSHFQKALSISGPATLNKFEVQFHAGHLHHLLGQYAAAKRTYEGVLSSKLIPNDIRALTLKQLGWLYHTVPEICHPNEDPHNKAVDLLKLAVGADPFCGQTWYFLGRCHAAQGRSHEAFLAYQQAVNKSTEDQADIWCSIGILYHNMSQPRDSLQAYLCAVYLDSSHTDAWKNLGCLYEAVAQPIDALICYKNSLTALQKTPGKDKPIEFILSRIANLEQYTSAFGPALLMQPRTLQSVQEGWYSLIPNHIRKKMPNPITPMLQLPGLHTLSVPSSPTLPSFASLPLPPGPPTPLISALPPCPPTPLISGPPLKKPRTNRNKDPIILKNMNDTNNWLNPSPLTPGLFSPVPMTPFQPGMEMTNPGAFPLRGGDFRIGPIKPPDPLQVLDRGLGLAVSPLGAPMEPRVIGVSSLEKLKAGMVLPGGLNSSELPGYSHSYTMAGNPLVNPHLFQDSKSNVTESDLHRSSTSTLPADRPLDLSLLPQKRRRSDLSSPNHHHSLPATICHLPTDQSSTVVSPSSGVTNKRHSITTPIPETKHPVSSSGYHSSQVAMGTNLTNAGVASHSLSLSLNPMVMSSLGSPSCSITAMPRLPFHTNSSLTSTNPFLSSRGPFQMPPSLFINQPSIVTWNSMTGFSQERHRHSSFDLPGDLTSIVPLNLGSELPRMDDYLEVHSQKTPAGERSSKDGRVRSNLSTSSLKDILQEPGRMATSTQQPRRRLSSNNPFSPVMISPTGIVSPWRMESHHLRNDVTRRTSTGDNRSNSRSEYDKMGNPKTPLENNSDSSSGISSGGTKLSTSSSDNSSLASPTSPQLLLSPNTPLLGGILSQRDQSRKFLDPLYEPFPALGDEAEYMTETPELKPPDPPVYSEDIDLKPRVPIYKVCGKEEAFSRDLHTFCANPSAHISMIRGLVEPLGLDLGLFTSKSLVETCPDHEMEVREQIYQAADENCDPSGKKQIWKCESSKCLTSIQEHARYQTRVLLGKEEELSQSDFSDSSSSGSETRRRRKLLMFGTNVDLSNTEKWKRQLKELEKLPKFLRVTCPEGNFLTHIGHTILGMNSVQLYMKVPGSRTPGHQENNNFCSINVNIGPGDCEWFAVPNKYWGVIHNLCEKHKVNYLVGSWWPILEELADLKVPVYRFTQYTGDIVWINPGTVHWVQANGVCNNIAWNTGPITAHQFRLSWERYQWNKIQRVRSIVPMIHMTWNLARTVKLTEETLYDQIRVLLETSLNQTKHLLSVLERCNIPVHWHGKMDGEPAPCCLSCLDEVFNILFVIGHKDEWQVYCHKCAMALKRSFSVLQQYETEELEETLASFQLHKKKY